MPKQRKILLLGLILMFSLLQAGGTSQADTTLPMGEILKKTESYYQSLQAFTSQFVQVTTSSATNTITTEASGLLYYQKPRQMRWEYQTPEKQVFIANQKYAWLYEPSERQISLFDPTQFFDSPLARTFFDGVAGLRNNFEVSLDSEHSNPSMAVLKLTPKKEDPNIKRLRLWIDTKTFEITQVETQDALANTNLIVLKSQKASTDLNAKLFQLDVPSSTNVVDAEGRRLPEAEIKKLQQKLLSKQEGQS